MDNFLKSYKKNEIINFDRIVEPFAFIGHLPFVYHLIRIHRPQLLVELGTHSGNSFCAMCQSIKENNILAKAYAMDTWKGEEHSGYYGEEVFYELKEYVNVNYEFAELMKMTFDDGLEKFRDKSIDLLLIDGLHTYKAVKHDFETWLPKMKSSGVILLHDIVVHKRGFGVYKLWEELKDQFVTLEFHHSNGLGIVFLEDALKESKLKSFFDEFYKNKSTDWYACQGQLVIYNAEKNRYQDLYYRIKNSNSYRLGQFIIKPLANIRTFLISR